MNIKAEYRKKYKLIREFKDGNIKRINDEKILNYLLNSDFYNNSETILIYVSIGTEVDTSGIISHALTNNKTVAVPYCSGKTMLFYGINSTDDLAIGAYGIPTVNPDNSKLIIPDSKTLCVVPGLAFDKNGARLGYGGGYYDRYLNDKNVLTVGLCYQKCIAEKIPTEKYDVKLSNIITENGILSLNLSGGNTYE